MMTVMTSVVAAITDALTKAKAKAEAEAEAEAKAQAEAEAGIKAYAEFQRKVASRFRSLKPPAASPSFSALCFPDRHRMQPQQRFLERFLGPEGVEFVAKNAHVTNGAAGLLVYHKAGAGKTCAAVRVAEAWRASGRRIVVLLPASLASNFRNELNTCGDPGAASSPKYEVYSFHRFVRLQRGQQGIDLRNALLIVDEVQNVVSLKGLFYQTLHAAITAAPPGLRILLMSATPIYDRPSDIALTLNLLRPREPLPVGSAFNAAFLETKRRYTTKGTSGRVRLVSVKSTATNVERFAALSRGLVSYYEADPKAFPVAKVSYVRCPMSAYQYFSYSVHEDGTRRAAKYTDLLKLPTDFLLGLREISNVAFPNRLTGEAGLASLDDKAMTDMGTFSCKMARLMRALATSKGPVFVYSHFVRFVGIECLVRLLEHAGYTNVLQQQQQQQHSATKCYAVWSGAESAADRAAALELYNRPENRDGSLLKVILGSPAMKEGVSLLRAREVHILEPYWNTSRIEQVAGRARRFCSHRDLPIEQRRVAVYIYMAVPPTDAVNDTVNDTINDTINDAVNDTVDDAVNDTVDERIVNMAASKKQLSDEFLELLKVNAVDKELFY